MPTEIRRFVRGLGLDAYVVGGAVRDELLGIPHADEDFLVPGLDHDGLRAALEPHGRVEDMVVHGQLVGVRFHPRDRSLRSLPAHGIEITPPRAERSTGPRHRDFEIVSGPGIGVADDMARRDFTVNAMARRLADGELVDPFGGVADLEARVLRTVGPDGFREDPLRMLRGLRLVSQLGFDLAPETLEQMRREAHGLDHVSGERIGGGIAADGLGELSKLLLGRDPGRALRIGRDAGVLVHVVPEYADAIGYELGSERQPVTLDEHLVLVVEGARARSASLAVLLAALLHDLGKPEAGRTRAGHAAVGATIARRTLQRLRYPTALRRDVVEIVREHAFRLDGEIDERAARRFLAAHGRDRAHDLLVLKAADLDAKSVPAEEIERLRAFTARVESQTAAPHRIADLAIDGSDLIELGFREGPALGRTLAVLLDEVVDDPARNERGWLLERAAAEAA